MCIHCFKSQIRTVLCLFYIAEQTEVQGNQVTCVQSHSHEQRQECRFVWCQTPRTLSVSPSIFLLLALHLVLISSTLVNLLFSSVFWHQYICCWRGLLTLLSLLRLVAQSYLTLCCLLDYSPLGSSVHGIFQARMLVHLAISYSRESSRPRDWTQVSSVSCIGRRILYHPVGNPHLLVKGNS